MNYTNVVNDFSGSRTILLFSIFAIHIDLFYSSYSHPSILNFARPKIQILPKLDEYHLFPFYNYFLIL